MKLFSIILLGTALSLTPMVVQAQDAPTGAPLVTPTPAPKPHLVKKCKVHWYSLHRTVECKPKAVVH